LIFKYFFFRKKKRIFSVFSWARLELLAGLLQEVLLLSLLLSIIVDAINKLINPNHIEHPSVMIYLGSAGVCIGLLGLFLFRGYRHDHNIRHEIVEQKKNDFVQSVCDTLKNLDKNPEESLIKPNETSNLTEQRMKQNDFILPSLNDTYTNAFLVADKVEKDYEQHLRVPEKGSIQLNRIRRKSGESMVSSMLVLNEDKIELDDDFQESRVYATLHALCLHSLVNMFYLKN
jgi:Co/Zn/Cd efflux system component